MCNLKNRGIKSLRKEIPIEKVNKEREKVRLRMSKRNISEEGNPISSGIDFVVVSPPSPYEKHTSLVETNLVQISIVPSITISSRQVVVDDQMMEYFLGANYTMDEIREVN
jgi:hypothetical protein